MKTHGSSVGQTVGPSLKAHGVSPVRAARSANRWRERSPQPAGRAVTAERVHPAFRRGSLSAAVPTGPVLSRGPGEPQGTATQPPTWEPRPEVCATKPGFPREPPTKDRGGETSPCQPVTVPACDRTAAVPVVFVPRCWYNWAGFVQSDLSVPSIGVTGCANALNPE